MYKARNEYNTMNMIIKNIEYDKESIYVTGITNVGVIKGSWKDKERPIINEEYFFELSIPEIAQCEISILHDNDFKAKVGLENDRVLFKGVCEEIEDIYVVRFSEDWIEMVEVEEDDFFIKQGDYISFSVGFENVGIYPYYL